MSTPIAALSSSVNEELVSRLAAVTRLYADTIPARFAGGAPHSAIDTLLHLIGVAAERRDYALLWLIQATFLARYPTEQDFRQFQRLVFLGDLNAAAISLMKRHPTWAAKSLKYQVLIVSNTPIVEVSDTSTSEHPRGIGRVVRQVVPRWAAHHELVPAKWNEDNSALVLLSEAEWDRVAAETSHISDNKPLLSDKPTVVIPFNTNLLFLDSPVKDFDTADRVASMSRFAEVRQGHIVHDFIPITSADLRPWGEPNQVAAQFSMLKYAYRVAAISEATENEVAGLVSALPAQGLTGPQVRAILEPVIAEVPSIEFDSPIPKLMPVVLRMGALEAHKNPRAVIAAIEKLWRRGYQFEYRQMGERGPNLEDYFAACDRLIAAGYPLTLLGVVPENQLWQELSNADVAVFVSLQEGFGLPIVEALSVGTPVITANYGSQAEVAELTGGCLTVDPRDDEAIAAAIAELLDHPEVGAELVAAYQRGTNRTWDHYADETWQYLTGVD